MDSLRTTFKGWNHRPSKSQWDALEAIASTLAQMAVGICPQKPHLSTLDPGVGKTQVMVHFLRELMKSPYRDVGVLLCIGRKDQLRDIIGQAGLADTDYAFLTADEDLNAKGRGRDHANDAPVLFTTHRMVELRVRNQSSFADVDAFHYRGKPRAVRVWDEALLPSLPLTVKRSDLGSLFTPLRKIDISLAARVERLWEDLGDKAHGSTHVMPDTTLFDSLSLFSLRLRDAKASDDAIKTAEALWMLSGKVVTVHREGGDHDDSESAVKDRRGYVLLDFHDHLPDDLWPILILDASGRVRTLYRYWEERRQGLVRLKPDGAKSYASHTVHIMKASGSKSAWKNREKAKKLLSEIASVIAARPSEKWLVVHHKKESLRGFDTVQELQMLLSPDIFSNVCFTTWGKHDASNEWKDIPNVILAGLMYLPKSTLEARGRCASNYPSAHGKFVTTDLDEVAIGEYRHDCLQAICRGSVRGLVNGACPPKTHTYIVVRPKDGVGKRTISELLPGAVVEDWISFATPALSKRRKEALDIITKHREITVYSVMAAMEWPEDKSGRVSFLQNIRQNPDFVQALTEAGYSEQREGTGRGGQVSFKRLFEPAYDF